MGLFIFLGFNHDMALYLLSQGRGQLQVIARRQSLEEFAVSNELSARELQNLKRIPELRRFAEEELGFKKTDNYSYIYDQERRPSLWVLSASEPFELKEVYWDYPMLGELSYKGFFDPYLAAREFLKLRRQGYDVEVRTVSAWSTLGWFNDPMMSNNLRRSAGDFANLIFHELFHASYYKPGHVELNENLANFVADKATRLYFAQDTIVLNQYKRSFASSFRYRAFVGRQAERLSQVLQTMHAKHNRHELKRGFYAELSDSIEALGTDHPARARRRVRELQASQNAYFVSFRQYDSMQDSLEKVFNKNYTGDLKKMVRHLRQE